MVKKKKKGKKEEPDLFEVAKTQKIAKPKEWRFPDNVRFADVNPGDIFIFSKARDWDNDAKVKEMRGVVLDKGLLDTKNRYFTVKMLHPESEIIEEEDIRRFILPKK